MQQLEIEADSLLDNRNNDMRKSDNLPRRLPGTGISSTEAGISLAKAIMGAGSFALPWAFSRMGYLAGPLFLGCLMALSVQSLKWLVLVARATGQSSYVEVARAIFGPWGAKAAYVASISASMGVCGSYLLFIAANLESMSSEGSMIGRISETSWILIVLPLVILLSSVRDMKHFAFASLLGDIAVTLGMVVVVIYGLLYNSIGDKECTAVASWQAMPLAFGSIGYLFLVHFLVLPIESAMEQPESFQHVAFKTFLICALLSGGFGVIGYLLFGEETEQIVLLNVQGSFFVSAVKLLLCVDLLFTYPVVMRPSIVIVEQGLKGTTLLRNGPLGSVGHMAVCCALGFVAAAGALFVPAFGLLSGLVGGVSQTFLAFVMPPLMLHRFQNQDGGFLQRNWREIGTLIFGAILIVWTISSTWNELK